MLVRSLGPGDSSSEPSDSFPSNMKGGNIMNRDRIRIHPRMIWLAGALTAAWLFVGHAEAQYADVVGGQYSQTLKATFLVGPIHLDPYGTFRAADCLVPRPRFAAERPGSDDG